MVIIWKGLFSTVWFSIILINLEDHKVIDKIIAHLKFTFMAELPPPPQVVQHELLMAAEERGEYF